MVTTEGARRIAAATDAVADERQHAETLLYRLTTAKLLLGAGEAAFLPRALAEVELVTAQLESAGRQRDHTVAALASAWRMDAAELTLPRLAARAPHPWSLALTDHLEGLVELTDRIATTAATDRSLAATALDFVRRRLAPGPRRLEDVGHPRELELVRELQLDTVVTELRVQEITYEMVIDAAAACLPAGLRAFLGEHRGSDRARTDAGA